MLETESWAENPGVTRISRAVQALLQEIPQEIDQKAKLEIRDRKDYIQIVTVCTFRISTREG